MVNMYSETVCVHNKFGYCKHKNSCRKRHVEEICISQECDVTDCEKRHPQICKYFRSFGRCKFGGSCAYVHDLSQNNMLLEIQVLKDNIKELDKQIQLKHQDIMFALERISNYFIQSTATADLPNVVSSPKLPTPTIASTLSSLSLDDHATETFNGIPQVDGNLDPTDPSLSPPPDNFECDNCGALFDKHNLLELHNELNQFGCDEDDCGLCFPSKYLADLHELEFHPETSYAEKHIPDSTKEDFSKGRRCSP